MIIPEIINPPTNNTVQAFIEPETKDPTPESFTTPPYAILFEFKQYDTSIACFSELELQTAVQGFGFEKSHTFE
ncbi:hypothetical protein N7486_000473 [Penicillium sp. IBT 16267x]|nr:hypothetical protein N7486_000473 [Penicillium sp. IBT 16267x]